MKIAHIISLIFLLPLIGISQASIICPPDVTINAENLDQTYSTYGDPIITNGDQLNLTKEVTTVYNSCESEFNAIVTLTYTLVDPSTQDPKAACNQIISMTPALLEDVVFPPDITLSGIKVSDAKPSLAGLPNLYDNNSNMVFAWNDSDPIINSAAGTAKILRTWTVLFWCTGDFMDHVQIINIQDLVTSGDNTSSILTCSGDQVVIDDIIISTSDATVSIDPSGCTLEDDNIKDFVNCVVANNPIADNLDYTINIIRNDNHLNGVSTLDLILIQRHILGIESLDNPCDIIAADASNNGIVTAIDLVEIRKLILSINVVLPNSPSWKFLTGGGSNANEFKPLIFSESEFPLEKLDIVAIKVGDVNGTAVGN